jgi:hypothetical protein
MTDAKDVRDTLKAIAFMVRWSPHGVQVMGNDALKDILNHIDTLTRERDAAANLLAVIHGDGGHHTASVGFARSCVDAEAVVLQDRTARNEARDAFDTVISLMPIEHPDAPMASLDHEVRAVIANRYGMSVIAAVALTQGDA